MGADVIPEAPDGVEYFNVSERFKLPIDDATVDVVTANMTLHHIKNVEECIAEILRVLRPGGIVFIREHDCWTVVDAMLVDIEHRLYDAVGSDAGEYAIYHYTNYHGWDKMFKPLEYVNSNYFYTGVRNEISATRGFWCVYRKV